MNKISKRQQRLQNKGIQSQFKITLKSDMDSRFTLEENRLLSNLSIPNSTEQWKGISIKNEEIALLDYFYGANALQMHDKAKLAIGMLYKCNPKLVDLIFA
jgi:hypothetical protein